MMKQCLLLLAMLVLVGCQSNTQDVTPKSGMVRPGKQTNCFPNRTHDQVFFAYDSAVLSPEAQKVLDTQASWFERNLYAMAIIEGHADERGTREYNLALGERRATAAKRYLIANGVDASRISIISYGKERPAVVGSAEQVLAKNRRAMTVVKEAKKETKQ